MIIIYFFSQRILRKQLICILCFLKHFEFFSEPSTPKWLQYTYIVHYLKEQAFVVVSETIADIIVCT